MYVIEEGRLRAYVERDGQQDDIEYLRKGDCFGEVSVLQAAPRSATVEALTPCRLLALPVEPLTELLAECPTSAHGSKSVRCVSTSAGSPACRSTSPRRSSPPRSRRRPPSAPTR